MPSSRVTQEWKWHTCSEQTEVLAPEGSANLDKLQSSAPSEAKSPVDIISVQTERNEEETNYHLHFMQCLKYWSRHRNMLEMSKPENRLGAS